MNKWILMALFLSPFLSYSQVDGDNKIIVTKLVHADFDMSVSDIHDQYKLSLSSDELMYVRTRPIKNKKGTNKTVVEVRFDGNKCIITGYLTKRNKRKNDVVYSEIDQETIDSFDTMSKIAGIIGEQFIYTK